MIGTEVPPHLAYFSSSAPSPQHWFCDPPITPHCSSSDAETARLFLADKSVIDPVSRSFCFCIDSC